MKRDYRTLALGGLALASAAGRFSAAPAQPVADWAIDACLTRHVSDDEFPGYLRLLGASGVRIVRERDVGTPNPDGSYGRDIRPKLERLTSSGYTVVAFVPSGIPGESIRGDDTLPEDLRQVYALGQRLRHDFASLVQVWEMTGEPDVGFCRDLPERTVAYQKALYLGLKTGAGPSPEVLMGAMALPPGPWLERAASNGMLDYTDAYNFHFYGHAADFAGLIQAQRVFMERWTAPGARLPLWITECGIKTVAPDNFLNADRRQLQSAFVVATARDARAEGAAVFMPFVLAAPNDAYALTLSAARPLPAWTAYAKLTRELAWPRRPLARLPRQANPVVLQWLPDEGSAVSHKVSGTYRFRRRQPISGELRIYNLGSRAVHGRLADAVSSEVISTFPRSQNLSLAPGQLMVLRGEFRPTRAGYFQAWWQGDFIGDDGSQSPLSFGLETLPAVDDFVMSPLPLAPLASGLQSAHLLFSDYRVSSKAPPWIGTNGVEIVKTSVGGARFRVTQLTGDPVGDPLYPPQAVAGISDLPDYGFLVIRPDRPFGRNFAVRVDLVDARGQRFTIWENFGQSYAEPRRELWLNLRDFHRYFWGPCGLGSAFPPKDIRELQLRFYCEHSGEEAELNFSVALPKASGDQAELAAPVSELSNSGE